MLQLHPMRAIFLIPTKPAPKLKPRRGSASSMSMSSTSVAHKAFAAHVASTSAGTCVQCM
jgi:hypothetical protein